jgi:hypothetical protein
LGSFARVLATHIVFRGEFDGRNPLVKLADKVQSGGAHTYGPVIAALSPGFVTCVEVPRRDSSRFGLCCAPGKDGGVILVHFNRRGAEQPVEMLPMIVKRLPCERPPAINWRVLATEKYPGTKAYDVPRGRGMRAANRERWADWWEAHIQVDIGGQDEPSWVGHQSSRDLTLMAVLRSPLAPLWPTFEPWTLHELGIA